MRRRTRKAECAERGRGEREITLESVEGGGREKEDKEEERKEREQRGSRRQRGKEIPRR